MQRDRNSPNRRTRLVCFCFLAFVTAMNTSGRPMSKRHVDGTADLYVSPRGSDSAAGTPDAPLRTVREARDRLRPTLANMDRDRIVLIRDGVWYLENPISFGPEDSGKNGFDVIYKNYPDERPVFVGGRLVTNWTRSAKNLWAAEVGEGFRFQQLFLDEEPLTKAREPDSGYFYVESPIQEEGYRAFHYKAGDIPDSWAFGPEAQVFIWSGQDWFSDLAPVVEIAQSNRTIRLSRPTLSRIVRLDGYTPDRRYFVQGVREALDEKGEFFLDEAAGIVYLRADRKAMRRPIIAPTINRVFEIRGVSPEKRAHHLRFEGLTVSVSRFDSSFKETEGTHGKTPWNEPANRDGLVYLEHTDHCAIRFCLLENAGYSAISLNGASQFNNIYGNHIRNAGYHGILLTGDATGHGKTLDVHRDNDIENNHIHHCGRLVGHGGGIFMHSSGHNRIAHNLIHHMPRYGIGAKGASTPPKGKTYEEWMPAKTSRDNTYEYNHLHHCNLDSEDSGFISFIATGPHNVVRHNLIHDNPRELGGLSMGIYLDDGAGYFTISHNVIYNINGGEAGMRIPIFAKGVHNRIVNNILICCDGTRAAILCRNMFGLESRSHVWAHNIVSMESLDTYIWEFPNWDADRLKGCDSNIFWNTKGVYSVRLRDEGKTLDMTLAEWRRFGPGTFDRHSLTADPCFVNAAADDYSLQPYSPAFALGFEPVHAAACGLLSEVGPEARSTRD